MMSSPEIYNHEQIKNSRTKLTQFFPQIQLEWCIPRLPVPFQCTDETTLSIFKFHLLIKILLVLRGVAFYYTLRFSSWLASQAFRPLFFIFYSSPPLNSWFQSTDRPSFVPSSRECPLITLSAWQDWKHVFMDFWVPKNLWHFPTMLIGRSPNMLYIPVLVKTTGQVKEIMRASLSGS